MTKSKPRPRRIVPLAALAQVVGGAQPPKKDGVITGIEFPEAKGDPTTNSLFTQLAFPT